MMASDAGEPSDDSLWRASLPSITVVFPLASASVSLLFCAVYIAMFLSNKRLRRHPSSLVFGRAVYDFLFCAQLAFQLTRSKSALECKTAAALMQFSMLASECCFLGISIDLRLALTQPFHDYKATRRSLNVGIFVANALVAAALAWRQAGGRVVCHGSDVTARECLPVWLSFERHAADRSLLVCWQHDAHSGAINWSGAQLFFVLPVLSIYAFALYVYYGLAAKRLRSGGLRSSLETRRAVLERSRRLLLFFNGYVLLQCAPYLTLFLLSSAPASAAAGAASTVWEHAYYACSELFLVVLGARGVATVTGWYLATAPRWADEVGAVQRGGFALEYGGAGAGAVEILVNPRVIHLH
jgi:hypothetical protein